MPQPPQLLPQAAAPGPSATGLVTEFPWWWNPAQQQMLDPTAYTQPRFIPRQGPSRAMGMPVPPSGVVPAAVSGVPPGQAVRAGGPTELEQIRALAATRAAPPPMGLPPIASGVEGLVPRARSIAAAAPGIARAPLPPGPPNRPRLAPGPLHQQRNQIIRAVPQDAQRTVRRFISNEMLRNLESPDQLTRLGQRIVDAARDGSITPQEWHEIGSQVTGAFRMQRGGGTPAGVVAPAQVQPTAAQAAAPAGPSAQLQGIRTQLAAPRPAVTAAGAAGNPQAAAVGSTASTGGDLSRQAARAAGQRPNVVAGVGARGLKQESPLARYNRWSRRARGED